MLLSYNAKYVQYQQCEAMMNQWLETKLQKAADKVNQDSAQLYKKVHASSELAPDFQMNLT